MSPAQNAKKTGKPGEEAPARRATFTGLFPLSCLCSVCLKGQILTFKKKERKKPQIMIK